MKDLFVESSRYTPYIFSNHNQGVLDICGESYMEHPIEFYEPVISWVHHFFKRSQTFLKLNFRLKYFNTGSSRAFHELFSTLEKKANLTEINWHVEPDDSDILMEGESFQEDFPNLYFNIITQ